VRSSWHECRAGVAHQLQAKDYEKLNTPPDYRREDVWVVIPTLNEVATLPAVVDGVRPYCAGILVIDGGSTDGTIEWARTADVHLKVLDARGKGLALRRALELVPVPVTVFIDADGSHDPHDLPALVAPVLRDEADLVVGSRWEGGSDELHGDMNKWLRRSGSKLLTTLVNLRFQGRMTDIQNGFRAFKTKIGREIGLRENDFTIEQEMVMKFLAGGFRVCNVPSHEYARQGGEAKLDLGKVWFRFGIVVLRHLFGLSRPRLRRGRMGRNLSAQERGEGAEPIAHRRDR
jgi:glycosyltransferase involved in cell wall biosynthesis